MRKTIVLLLALLYTGITSGVMVNIHYCMGKVAAVNYGHEEDRSCGECGMEKKDGCCKTEHKLLKSDNEHLTVKTFNHYEPATAILPTFFSSVSIAENFDREPASVFYHTPPDPKYNHLRLFNGVFRI